MAYRDKNWVPFEAKIEFKSGKSYLVEATLGGRYFLPFSQIRDYPELPEADENGNRLFEVSEWWFGVKEEVVDK